MSGTKRAGSQDPLSDRATAIDAVAEAIVLADPADATSFEVLLRALDRLGAQTPAGVEGDSARDRMADIAITAGRLMHAPSRDVASDMASLAHGFADVRRALDGGEAGAVR